MGVGQYGAAGGLFFAPGCEHEVVLLGVGQVGLFVGVEYFVQPLQALGYVGGVGPVGEVLGFDEEKGLAGRVGDEYVGQFAAQALVAQVGVGVERDVGGLQAEVAAACDVLDVAVELADAFDIAGGEFVEEVPGKKLAAEVALFFGFDEGGVREDHRNSLEQGRWRLGLGWLASVPA